MVYRLLCGLFAVLCLLEGSEGARISNCAKKYIEGLEDANLQCDVNRTSTVRWTLVNKTGATLHLATCYGPHNCTNPYNPYLNIRHSYAHFKSISLKFSGDVTCQETLTNGTVLTDTCKLNVGRVQFQANRHLDIRENGTEYIYCYNTPHKPITSKWSLTTTSGQTLDLGTCVDDGNCTSPHAPDFTVQKTYYFSQVSIRMVDRSKGGYIFCSYTYNDLKDIENATLNVYSPATVSNCHAEVHPGNWSTILSCDVSNVFSSSGGYTFRVFEYFEVLKHGKLFGAPTYLFDGRLSYRHMLTPYTNITNNKVYYRGRLTYSWPLLPTPGIYTNLTVNVYSGFFVYTTGYVGYKLNITTPSQPTHNCSELNYIPETGVVPCVCTADYLGSPAGRLIWLLGNIAIATGDYGVTQLTLPSGQVSRQHDGMMVTCQLDWVQPINTTFTRHVASFSQSQTERDQFNWTAVGVGVGMGIVIIALVVLVVVIIGLCRRGRQVCDIDTSQTPNTQSQTPNTQTSHDDEDSHY